MTSSIPKQIAERLGQGYAAVATFIFLSSGILYLWLGRSPTTYQDFWLIYETCLNRSWWYSALLRYNGHSHFFPSQIWLADLRYFQGSQDVLFVVGFTLQLISIALLVIPIWRDAAVGRTERLAAILMVVTINMWMARANMTASGGFNCCYSLTLGGAALAFLCLPARPSSLQRPGASTLVVIAACVVASFSFGTGLAIWATVLLLGYCLRVPFRLLALLLGSAVICSVIYTLLPARVVGASFFAKLTWTLPSTYLTLIEYLCRLLGSPFSHGAAAWLSSKATSADQFATLSVWAGASGLFFACCFLGLRVHRRDLKAGLAVIGLGLMVFNLIAIALITIARAEHIRVIPSELNAPRYLFWSSLFWVGLLLLALNHFKNNRLLRAPIILFVLAIPIVLFPSHHNEGLRWRFARYLQEAAATGLINGVRDESKSKLLFRNTEQVYHLAEQLRQRRLDMFADGLQDWIGKTETELFDGKHASSGLTANCRVDAYVKCDDGAPAARVVGWARTRGQEAPNALVLIDATGKICGVARTFSTSSFINRAFYSKRFSRSSVIGYIRNYNPTSQYAMRSADNQKLSDERILIPAPAVNIPAF